MVYNKTLAGAEYLREKIKEGKEISFSIHKIDSHHLFI